MLLLVAVCIHEGYVTRLWKRIHPAPKTAYSYLSNTHFNEELDFGTLYLPQANIVMLGNSLTQKMAWNELLRRCDVVNRGVSVDVTAGILARLPRIISLHPKIVFIEGGINDIGLQIPDEQIIGNLSKIVDTLNLNGIIPVVNLIDHVSNFYLNEREVNQEISRINESLVRMATEKKAEVINLNQIIAPNDTLLRIYARGDGCHLTSKTYTVWKEAIEKILQKHGI